MMHGNPQQASGEAIGRISSKVILTADLILIMCAVWTAVLDLGLNHATPEVITQARYINHYIEKPIYIEVEKLVPEVRPVYIEVAKTIDIVREVKIPVTLKDWGSLEQLEEFLASDDTDERIILTADSQGKISFDDQCKDFALQLRDRAMARGMFLSIIALHPKEYEKWYDKRLKTERYHAISMARIGNELWYIEPTTDEHWLALYLD